MHVGQTSDGSDGLWRSGCIVPSPCLKVQTIVNASVGMGVVDKWLPARCSWKSRLDSFSERREQMTFTRLSFRERLCGGRKSLLGNLHHWAFGSDARVPDHAEDVTACLNILSSHHAWLTGIAPGASKRPSLMNAISTSFLFCPGDVHQCQ